MDRACAGLSTKRARFAGESAAATGSHSRAIGQGEAGIGRTAGLSTCTPKNRHGHRGTLLQALATRIGEGGMGTVFMAGKPPPGQRKAPH